MPDTLDLLDLDVLNTDRRRALVRLFQAPGQTIAQFVNAHCVNVARGDRSYARALDEADVLLPDGSGMQLAAAMTGRRFRENLNGTDLFLPLCREAADRGAGVYLLGAAPGIAERAAETAMRAVPGLKIAGSQHGYFDPAEEDGVIDAINRSGARVLLVAMGVPIQELWIARNRHRLAPRLIMGVGAQFDFHAGAVSRAPKILRRAGCEWMWRLAVEPKRMARRYLLGNPLFVGRALRNAVRWHARRVDTGAVAKRALDIVGASVALTLLSPLILGAALAIRVESPGAILFRQVRIGRDGKPFSMFKLRSMYRDAEARRAALLAESDRTGICFKSANDPRITRTGRIIRKLSIDELPQLLNILRGEMSLVGPRPALPQEVAAYPERARRRLAVKPGLTGLWQVSGRADIGFDKMIDMDLAYVRSRSLLLDLVLLALTARAVLSRRGAY